MEMKKYNKKGKVKPNKWECTLILAALHKTRNHIQYDQDKMVADGKDLYIPLIRDYDTLIEEFSLLRKNL